MHQPCVVLCHLLPKIPALAATGKPKCSTPRPEEQNPQPQTMQRNNAVAACFKYLRHAQQCRFSELPVFLHRFDCPIKLLTQSLREKLLDRHSKFLTEDHSKTRINVILRETVSIAQKLETLQSRALTILEVPSATSLLLSLSFRCMSILLIR